jgi:hypothetical protein
MFAKEIKKDGRFHNLQQRANAAAFEAVGKPVGLTRSGLAPPARAVRRQRNGVEQFFFGHGIAEVVEKPAARRLSPGATARRA